MCISPVVAGGGLSCSVHDWWTQGVHKSGPLWIVVGRPQGQFEMTTVAPTQQAVIHWFSPDFPHHHFVR